MSDERPCPEVATKVPDREVCQGIVFERRAERCSGAWVIAGTRMTVSALRSFGLAGHAPATIRERFYPHLTVGQIKAAIALPAQLGDRWPADDPTDDRPACRACWRVLPEHEPDCLAVEVEVLRKVARAAEDLLDNSPSEHLQGDAMLIGMLGAWQQVVRQRPSDPQPADHKVHNSAITGHNRPTQTSGTDAGRGGVHGPKPPQPEQVEPRTPAAEPDEAGTNPRSSNASVTDRPAILVWRFYDAPEEYQALSPHGGDEDWIAFIPTALADESLFWMESGTAFGWCDVSKHPVNGGQIRIGAHS